MVSLDAHARPPESMKAIFKKWQKLSIQEIETSAEILDLRCPESTNRFCEKREVGVSGETLARAFTEFASDHSHRCVEFNSNDVMKYEISALPGLYVYPCLLPNDIQVALLNKLLHRDLSDQSHKSNLHLHYHIEYPGYKALPDADSLSQSFFLQDQDRCLSPKDPTVHKPLSIKHMLDRKLRWITLGGQYDWTAKVYPEGSPPQFPSDIASLLKSLFPRVDAQAAIVNFYTPGDTLSVHRDVSEECDRDLISISIGCDGIFIIGNGDGTQTATLRLRSGDVVIMSGPSRYAWHAVPRILPHTCPDELRSWPSDDYSTMLDSWNGWLGTKRINLNVRQMRS